MDLQADIARTVKQNSRAAVPAGGLTGRVLRKGSDADYDVGWAPDGGVPGGGTTGQVLTKTAYTDGSYDWSDPPSAGGGGPPTDWVEWVPTGTQTGFAYNSTTFVPVDWDDSGSSGLTHGTAISLVSGHAEVTEDGWYCLDGWAEAAAAGGTTWDEFVVRVDVTRSFSIGGDSQDSVFLLYVGPPTVHGSAPSGVGIFNWTGYMMSGDTAIVKVRLQATTDPSATWQIPDGQFRMEKLPL